jgi:cellulose synthase/poly-beta-1,6-N-acetylglucosamine synthase-like glycosyltransferase
VPRRVRRQTLLPLPTTDLSSLQPAEISVLVPTFRRSESLCGCLEALTVQTSPPAEIVVVMRDDDLESHIAAECFAGRLPLRMVRVDRPGQVEALNRGLSVVRARLVAITDDDARPRADWIERITAHFADPQVGAVGGRDRVYWAGELLGGRARLVGRVRWYGRIVGNHHLESALQDVQFLKGVNMSYRRDLLLGFDEHLAGDGSQICNDMQASLRIHVSGWRVVWDPDVTVDHYPAERFDEDKRGDPTLRAVANVLHNQTYILLSLLTGWRRITSLLYPVVVGTRATPGLLTLPLAMFTARSAERTWFGFRANLQGRFRGVMTFCRTRGQPRFPSDLDR